MERMDYFLRRLLLIIPTFLGITLLCFTLTRFLPGGPVEQAISKMKGVMVGEAGHGSDGPTMISKEYKKQLESYYGYNQPFYKGYYEWLVHNHLGMKAPSYKFPNKNAWQLICQRLPVSLIFGITGFILSYLICIPLGITKALRHGGRFDLISSAIVFLGYAMPVVALGMVLKMLFCGTVENLWDFFPVAGFEADNFAALPWPAKLHDRFMHMFLPVMCYVIGNFAVLTILMKNSLLEQIGKDYIRTVLARGGSSRHAIWGHAFRNAVIPIATGFGGILMVMFAGSVIIEQIFEIQGMGRLSMDAIVGRDYPVFLGILSLTSILGLLGNILSDFCYVLIDPRINFQR